MAYYANEDEQYQELQEMPLEHQMEERLVEALAHHVQDSVNWALIQALKHFTPPLTTFAKREFLGESSQQPRLQSGDPKKSLGLPLQRSGGSSSAEILAQVATSVLRDHAYGGFPPPQDASSNFQQSSFYQSSYQDPSSSKSDSDEYQSNSLPRKKKRKSRHSMSEATPPAGESSGLPRLRQLSRVSQLVEWVRERGAAAILGRPLSPILVLRDSGICAHALFNPRVF
ncbi:hypothetical protein NDU88_006494 [Pleurodeles waltl]|uniref:Uncharacterized protein n=1 Tax=Pleurodeles waltl TaxID=8319 RepID=A0AAV7LFJ6_PLEWA|nr:hypothetical protein NDU88_006494 [Pleurodeles waltl]